MNNIKYKYIIIFFVLVFSTIFTIMQISKIRIAKAIEAEKMLVGTTYKSILNEYSTHAKIIYENVINKDEILKIFYETKTNPNEARKKLYNKLKSMYENMQAFKLKQLHFHLKNNNSFLRFHRPQKYGDNLSSVRASVKYVNQYKEFIAGFEEGRIYNGFRFVYPLSYHGEHLGSVETSISMNSIIESMSSLLDAEVKFILDGSIVKDKVFKSERLNYKVYSSMPTHLIEKDAKETKLIDRVLSNDIELNDDRLDSTIDMNIVSFHTVLNSKHYILTMLDINRVLSDTTVAHFIILREHENFALFKIQEYSMMVLLIILVLLVMFFMYKSEKQNKELRDSSKKFKKLFDLQKNIMVVTDGKKIKMANDGMCQFFGIDYLEFFMKHHNDISDRFIESEHYFNISEMPQHLTWIDTIEGLVGDKKIVVMHDKHNMPHVFNVSVSKYEGSDYIVLFTDISDTMIEKMNLSKRIVEDTLTNVYNREFFNTNIKSIIRNIPDSKHLGLAMLDIDLFKNVNDNYGHDVGDSVLVELSDLVKNIIRENDYFIRWGGEEFIILLRLSTPPSLEKALEHVRQSIDAYKFSGCGHITCSIGATLYIKDEDISESVKRADRALYKSKENGRNKLTIS